MRAIVIHQYGGPDVLRYEEVPDPAAAEAEILVRVHAVSVNRSFDLLVREGKGGYPVKLPYIMGVDPSGVVEAVGPGVAAFKPGDRISAQVPVQWAGGYAELVTVPAASAFRIPDGLGFAEATVVGRHFPTAYGLARTVDLKPGEWVLVMGAAGGLGSCAVQVAKQIGARVIAGAGAPQRVQAALDLGADYGVNYRAQDLEAEVRRITDGHGVDAVFENIADPTLWPGAFNSLAVNGRLVTVGAHGGPVVPLDVRQLYHRRLRIMSGLRGNAAEDYVRSLEMAAAGKLKVLIDRVLPLSHAAEAHRLAETSQALGKVILDPTLG